MEVRKLQNLTVKAEKIEVDMDTSIVKLIGVSVDEVINNFSFEDVLLSLDPQEVADYLAKQQEEKR